MTTLTVAELCTGYAGLTIALQQAAHALSGLASRVDLLDLLEGGTA